MGNNTIVEEKPDYSKESDAAYCKYVEGRLDEAKDDFLNLTVKYPEESISYYYLGEIFLERNELQNALDFYKLALEKEKNEPIKGYFYYGLSKVFGRGGPFDEVPASMYDEQEKLKYLQLARQAGRYPVNLLFDLQYYLNNQAAITLFEEGIVQFPDNINLHLSLARKYGQVGHDKERWETLSKALGKGLENASLLYEVGCLQLLQKDPQSAVQSFEKALKIYTEESERFGLLYMLGRAFEQIGDYTRAKTSFRRAYEECPNEGDKLFGVFGIIRLNWLLNDNVANEDLILSLNVNRELLEENGRFLGGPLFLDGRIPSNIDFSNLEDVRKALGALKPQSQNPFLSGKTFILRAFLANSLGKYYDAYNALLKARKYLTSYQYPVIDDLQKQVLTMLVSYKVDSIPNAKKTFNIIASELSNTYSAQPVIGELLHVLIDGLFAFRIFEGIVHVAGFFDEKVLTEHDVLFKVAYSFAEIKNDTTAKKLYEHFLEEKGRDPGALNNLANIYKHEGDITKAIELYEEGLRLSPKDDILINNLKAAKLVQKEIESRSAKERELKGLHLKAIQLISTENDYVLEKLMKFIEQARKDDGFKDWELPIAKYKFHVFPGVDKQRGEQLREQWLKKGYITDTGYRDQHNAIIYAVNPYLETEIQRVQKRKIPEKWISGFMNISVKSLEDIQYFELADRIMKVNKKYRPLIERDFNELVHNFLSGNEKATIVLAGSLVELALTFYCERKRTMTLSWTDVRGNVRTKRLYDCVLSDLIEYVEQSKPFGADFIHLSNLSRIYRNFIHPGRELKETLDKSKADLCFVSTCEILRRIV